MGMGAPIHTLLERRITRVVAGTTVGLLLLLASPRNVAAQHLDPTDALLIAYRIGSVQEAAFNPSDGQLSPFWSGWSGDSAELAGSAFCPDQTCSLTGPQDASVTMKAAYTDRGVYLCLVARDNVWVVRQSSDDWGADAIALFVDGLSANEIFTCTDCLVGLYSSTLSYTTQQFNFWVGGDQADSFQFSHYDENLWSWQSMGLSPHVAEILFGFRVDPVTIDATHRALEIFMPWERFGGGLPVGTMLDGNRFGMTFGFNDKDGDSVDPDCLRWLGKDPWASDAQTTNYWGDLVLGPMINAPHVPPPPTGPELIPYTPDPTIDRTPTLTWHATENATNYKIVIDDDVMFTSPLVVDYTGGTTSYTPETLLPYGTVYWKVSANTDYALYSATGHLAITAIVPPPQLVAWDIDSTTDRHPALSWHGVPGATEYRIAIASDPECLQLIEGGVTSGATVYVPDEPLPLGDIYWCVSSNRDHTKRSAVAHFVVVELATPAARLPAEMASVSVADSLGWHAVRDPSSHVSYEVTISGVDDFSAQVYVEDALVEGLAGCLADLHQHLPVATMFFWKVRAVNERGQRSGYSYTASFILTPSSVVGSGTETIGGAWILSATPSGMARARFTVRAPSQVRMEIFDMSGARLARIDRGMVSRGTHQLVWDRRNSSGRRVGGGVYVVSLHIGERVMRQAVRLSH